MQCDVWPMPASASDPQVCAAPSTPPSLKFRLPSALAAAASQGVLPAPASQRCNVSACLARLGNSVDEVAEGFAAAAVGSDGGGSSSGNGCSSSFSLSLQDALRGLASSTVAAAAQWRLRCWTYIRRGFEGGRVTHVHNSTTRKWARLQLAGQTVSRLLPLLLLIAL